MAFDLLTNLDMHKNQLLNALLQLLSADPGSPTEGLVYHNNTDHCVHFYNGTAWIVLGRLDQLTAPAADVAMNSHKITGLAAPGSGTDAVNRDYVLGRTVNDLTAPSADFAMNNHKITGLATPTDATDAATRGYVLGLKVTDLTAPSTDWSVNSHKITSLSDGTGANDAVNKGQLDAAVAGYSWKSSVRAATTVTGTLASSFANGQVIDTVTLATGDRILIKNQDTGSENGIYVVAASGAPTRATDFDSAAEALGAAVFIREGGQQDTAWVCTNNTITLGSTALTFAQFTGGSLPTAGAGLTITGPTLDVIAGATPGTAGPGGGLKVNVDDVVIDTDVVVRKKAYDVGDNSSTSITLTHNLGTQDVTVSVYDKSSPYAEVHPEVRHATTNTVILVFAVAPTTAQYRAVIHG